jgi:hypothetical protein
MTLLGYTLFAFSSLFVIIDPIATVPVFLAMTPADSVEKRLRTARSACLIAGGVLMMFAFVGRWIFELLGLTIPAFQMAASIILLLIALDMLRAQRSRVKETHEETGGGRGQGGHRGDAFGGAVDGGTGGDLDRDSASQQGGHRRQTGHARPGHRRHLGPVVCGVRHRRQDREVAGSDRHAVD